MIHSLLHIVVHCYSQYVTLLFVDTLKFVVVFLFFCGIHINHLWGPRWCLFILLGQFDWSDTFLFVIVVDQFIVIGLFLLFILVIVGDLYYYPCIYHCVPITCHS